MVLVVKNLPARAGDTRDPGLIPGSERFPGVGNGKPFQYSCLETSMDRQRNLVAYSPRDCKESDMTERWNTSGKELACQFRKHETRV